MNGIKFVLGVFVIGVVSSASAQLLFTNLTLSSNSNLVSGVGNNNLNAVVYNGTSNFLAVGANQVFVCGDFTGNRTWFAGSNWTTGHVLSATNGLSLDAVTLGNNLFVATGDKNAIFSVTNVFAQIGGWTSNGNIFNNTAIAPGIAYNAGVYVGVGAAPVIGWTNAILSKTAFWLPATWSGQSFAESFRGVAAYGTNNGFAACGFYGDLLTTTNGAVWQPISGQVGEPTYFGIASDAGGQTLVSVGASSSGGVILISTNRAQTFPANGAYDTNLLSLASASQLNAVAYTGSGFIAVGNSGQVLTLTNSGGTWKTNGIYSPVSSSINLNGVAFGTAGYLAGVGELVGASGTVILAGTPPPAATNAVGATNCASYPAAANNGTLSVTVVTDANHPAGTVSADWYYQGSLVASGTTNFAPTNNPDLVTSNAPVILTFNAVERDLRTGFTSAPAPVTLEINPRPTATLVPLNTTDCNVGDAFILTNVLTGIGPWTVSWNDGTTQVVNGSGPVISTRTVFPTNTLPNTAVANIYYVTNVTSADTCLGNLPGDILGTNIIVINPRPTDSLTPFNTITCNEGNSFVLTNTLTGIGPWTVYWNDGTVQVDSQISGPATLTRTVFPTNVFANAVSNSTYFVTVVSNADMCTGNEPGDISSTTANILVAPRPTATSVSQNTTICNTGSPYVLTNTLTGFGSLTVYWNDGTVQSLGGPGLLTRTVFPTNTLPNASVNISYYITNIVDSAFGCVGDQPGDIKGTNTFTVNPRPTASLTSLITSQCNEAVSYTLTNTLNGLGPWTVIWNDGTVQVDSQAGPGPATLTRTISPTNTFGANTASNNVYFVSVVSNADTCEGNQPGDITGNVTITVNPLPTVTLAPLVTNVCNFGGSNVLTGTLTGLGTGGGWNIYWNNGVIQNVPGPAPAVFHFPVFPTNTLSSGLATNVYYVTNLVDLSSGCPGDQPGDITGTNLIIVSPLTAITLAITTNDFAVTTNGVSTRLLETISNPSASVFDLTVGFQYLQNGAPQNIVSQMLSVTNHLAFSGSGPWTVILSDGSKRATNLFVAAGSYVWQETITTNNDTNFTFSVLSVQTTNASCIVPPTNSYDVLVYGAPTALVYTTNTVCGSATNITTISAALGGFGPWTNVVWSDGFTNGLVTSSPFNRTVPTPANGTLAQIITNYSIVSLTDTYGATTTSSNDLAGSALVIVDPYASAPPSAQSSLNYSCATVPIPLSVTVPGGFTANWFDANTNLLTNGVTAYVSPAPGLATTNIFLVAAIYNDTNLNDGCDSPFAVITNIFENCSQQTSITLTGTNAVISWNGNFILQSTTNLLPPVMWMNVYTGALGPNFLTNSASQPPIDFFRLYTPTN